MHAQDTIVAISTPPGRGGIGIVRLSGPDAIAIATPLLSLRHPLTPARARFGHLINAKGEVLDECVATHFAAPNSYTTEDVVEIAAHGAPVLLESILRACILRGARLADPGEFTQRAFLNGRLDLTQAEAVHDLISASTLHQAKVAASQLGGALARTIAPSKASLINLIAELEAGVDFAEDDLDLFPEAQIAAQLASIITPLKALEQTFTHGRILREGFTLALAGAPNAGKSSLFNALLARERAIVTAQPGTTRDPISEHLAIAGIPIQLIDTAGLRDAPEGEAEALGIARTRQAMADADIILLISEGPPDPQLLSTIASQPHLLIRSKSDLKPTQDPTQIQTSAKTGEGLEALRQAILSKIGITETHSTLLTNLRQHTAVAEALTALNRATPTLPHELILLDLYAALEALDALTGATSQDDVLALIFSRFCIGK